MRSEAFTILGRLPGLNDYTSACRANRHVGANMKKATEKLVGYHIVDAHMAWFDKPVTVEFAWFEPNMRRDKDNIAFAKKFILDALVSQGIIAGDGWKHVVGFTDTFAVDKDDPRIVVTLTEG